jgi:hypothetical protein
VTIRMTIVINPINTSSLERYINPLPDIYKKYMPVRKSIR